MEDKNYAKVIQITNPKESTEQFTLESCLADAGKYKTKTEWKRFSFANYYAAKKNGWFEQCIAHMKIGHDVLTLDECIADAKQYQTRMDWRKNGRGYHTACKKGWLDQCCEHMLSGHVKWTKDLCHAEAQKYESLSKWYQGSQSSYRAAMRNGWMQEFSSMFKSIKKGRTKLIVTSQGYDPDDTAA